MPISHAPTPAPAGALPLVVHVGFAGPRHLFGADTLPEAREVLDAAVQAEIERVLRDLPRELGLHPTGHFLCGLSSLAIGADTLFTRACGALGIAQRILLPEPLDRFLEAAGSEGPDFTPVEQETARRLLASRHVVHHQVVGRAGERRVRFEEVNLELLRFADVCLAVVRSGSSALPGGTLDFIAGARLRRRPTLVLAVSVEGGEVQFLSERFDWPGSPDAGEPWRPPVPPLTLLAVPPPAGIPEPVPGLPSSAAAYLDAVKSAGSGLARERRNLFRTAALVVVLCHVLASACAVVAMKVDFRFGLAVLLGLELLLLGGGFAAHWWTHCSRPLAEWALSRVTAEVAASLAALRGSGLPLDALFTLPYPPELRPLLRTVHLLHLGEGRRAPLPWQERREIYLQERLGGGRDQLAYFAGRSRKAQRWLAWSNGVFYGATLGAVLATAAKLAFALGPGDGPLAMLGALAILLPVAAVAALSLAASFDLEASVHTYGDLHRVLEKLRPRIAAARSETEFHQFVLEAETRILGENANWASRRSFTGVT